MARANQTGTAVLGALSVEPMTGYALREAIRDVLGHFWNESFGQIYPTLDELERQGLVRRGGSKRMGASAFSLTPSGERRLRELLAQPIQRVPPRNGLMLRLFFGRHLGPQACRSLVLEAREEAKDQLARFEALRRELDAEQGYARDRPYWLLTISSGEHGARATIGWADETLAALGRIQTRKEGSDLR